MLRILCIILSASFMFACTMPDTKIYSLYLPDVTARHEDQKTEKVFIKGVNDDNRVSLVILMHSPRYLSQSYIVYRNSPYQLDISRYAKWAAPPTEMITSALRDYLFSTGFFKEVKVSNSVPEGYYAMELNLKKFERSDTGGDSFGEILFDVKLISPENKELCRDTISKRAKLGDTSFLNLAKGLSSAIGESIEAVRDSISKFVNPS